MAETNEHKVGCAFNYAGLCTCGPVDQSSPSPTQTDRIGDFENFDDIEAEELVASRHQLNEFQKIVYDWAVACFGLAHVQDRTIRGMRLLEEALEFAQAVNVPMEKCREIADYVYSRPAGEPSQELGGVAVTMLAAASSIGVHAHDVVQAEVSRVLAKSPEYFAARNQTKVDLGFTAESVASASIPQATCLKCERMGTWCGCSKPQPGPNTIRTPGGLAVLGIAGGQSEKCPTCGSIDKDAYPILGWCSDHWHSPSPKWERQESCSECDGDGCPKCVVPSSVPQGLTEMPKYAELWAGLFHDAYEELAPKFGYETRRESAVPWSDVPRKNRLLMSAVCERVLTAFSADLLAELSRYRQALTDLAEASLKLCEWVPDSAKGSSGYIRKERVKELAAIAGKDGK
jgi:hypothetical protein